MFSVCAFCLNQLPTDWSFLSHLFQLIFHFRRHEPKKHVLQIKKSLLIRFKSQPWCICLHCLGRTCASPIRYLISWLQMTSNILSSRYGPQRHLPAQRPHHASSDDDAQKARLKKFYWNGWICDVKMFDDVSQRMEKMVVSDASTTVLQENIQEENIQQVRMKHRHRGLRTKVLIKIKKYMALLVVCEMSPRFLSECLRFQRVLKQEKYFTIKKPKGNCPLMEAMLSVRGWARLFRWRWWSRRGPAGESWTLEASAAGGWRGREGAESEEAERASVQGVGVAASRPLDLLDVLQDHVV